MLKETDGRGSGSFRRLLAAPVLVLCVVFAGCAGDPASPSSGDPTAAPTADPSDSPPEDGSKDQTDAPADDPTGAPADDPTGTPADDPAGDGSGAPPTDDPGDPSDPGTTGWQEPVDPEAQGPTAMPELLEVSGTLDDQIELPTSMVVELASVATTTITAQTPGEYSGPAVVVSVHVTNSSGHAQSVESAVVMLETEDGETGVPTWAAPHDPLHDEVAAGETSEGTYVFMLDPATQRAVTVSVNYSAGEPVAVFTGHTS